MILEYLLSNSLSTLKFTQSYFIVSRLLGFILNPAIPAAAFGETGTSSNTSEGYFGGYVNQSHRRASLKHHFPLLWIPTSLLFEKSVLETAPLSIHTCKHMYVLPCVYTFHTIRACKSFKEIDIFGEENLDDWVSGQWLLLNSLQTINC